jgi:anti-anti-sigma factor
VERGSPGISVIEMSGEHDLSTAPGLREKLAGAIAERDSIVVDLSATEFVDSSILGALLDARQDAQAGGLGFAVALADGARPVARVLEVTGLSSTLPVHATREEAIAAVGTESGEV